MLLVQKWGPHRHFSRESTLEVEENAMLSENFANGTHLIASRERNRFPLIFLFFSFVSKAFSKEKCDKITWPEFHLEHFSKSELLIYFDVFTGLGKYAIEIKLSPILLLLWISTITWWCKHYYHIKRNTSRIKIDDWPSHRESPGLEQRHLASIFYETTQSWLPFQTTKTRSNANWTGF